MIDRLLAEPWRFEFAQAVRILELWLRQNDVVQAAALPGLLRFRNSVSLGFPASQIEALEIDAEVAVESAVDLLAALHAGQVNSISITPAFIGMLGAAGVLPLHYTEDIAAREQANKDEGVRSFFDACSSRSVALFHQAWAHYRVESRLNAQGEDGFLPLQLALAGGMPPAMGKDSPDESDLHEAVAGHYAAVLRHRPASASVIAGVLAEYFGVPVAFEPFVGCWVTMPPEDQSRLGGVNAELGRGATLGARYWRRDLRVRLRIGPLMKVAYERFLPGGDAATALAAMLAMFATAPLLYEVQLVLCAQDVEGIHLLSTNDEACARLGWDSFLITEAQTRNRDDMSYDLQI
ncbi:MAG: type VI secretion system baseplate subunit TssG [Telluria sp.]|nr:type VI secretion system baseplate subunit TssG [Telluria sp.]